MSKRIRYVGPADFKIVSAADFASFGITGQTTLMFDKAENFEADVEDDAAIFLLAQGDFEEETGLSFGSALDVLDEVGSLAVSGPHIAGSLPSSLSIIPGTIGNTEMDPTDPLDRANKIAQVEGVHYVGGGGEAAWFGAPNWGNTDATETTYYKAAYWYDPLTQMVYLRGVVTMLVDNPANQTVFTLPVGYRPSKRLVYPGMAYDLSAAVQVFGAVWIQSTGAISPAFGLDVGDIFYLDAVSFRAGV